MCRHAHGARQGRRSALAMGSGGRREAGGRAWRAESAARPTSHNPLSRAGAVPPVHSRAPPQHARAHAHGPAPPPRLLRRQRMPHPPRIRRWRRRLGRVTTHAGDAAIRHDPTRSPGRILWTTLSFHQGHGRPAGLTIVAPPDDRGAAPPKRPMIAAPRLVFSQTSTGQSAVRPSQASLSSGKSVWNLDPRRRFKAQPEN
jgi:hypothetical protein